LGKTAVEVFIFGFIGLIRNWGEARQTAIPPHLFKKRTPLFTPRKKISNLTKLEKIAFST
jgi:hypothetical protein